MKRRELIGILCLASLMAIDAGKSQTLSDADQVETVVRQYFDHLAQYDYAAMRAMATPEFETLDGGVRLTHPEFEDYVRGTAEISGAELQFELSQFNTEISSDVAYITYLNTITGSANLDGMILKRSGERWLIDRFFHMPVARGPEQVVRQYYHHIKAYNYEAMGAMTTPGFEIIYSGVRLDRAGFEERHREEEHQLGSAESRLDRFLYELSDFETKVASEVAYISFRATNPETTTKSGTVVPLFNAKYFVLFILRRPGEGSQWLVDRVFSMPEASGTD